MCKTSIPNDPTRRLRAWSPRFLVPAAFVVALLPLAVPGGVRASASSATVRFPAEPWAAVSPRVSAGALANRLECLVIGGGDTLHVAVSARQSRPRLSAGLVRALNGGTARCALHLAGGVSPQSLVELAGVPRLEPGKPPVLSLALSGAEVEQFLGRQFLREFSVSAQGRPLSGLVGPPAVADMGGGRYRLAMSLGQVVSLASPDTCQMLMFDRDAAYRVSVSTGLMSHAQTVGSAAAAAMPLAALGTPPAILLATPLQVELGEIPLKTPQDVRVSLANWGTGPADVPLKFIASGLAALDVPAAVRLEPGRRQDLAFQVQAVRGGALSGTLRTGGGSLMVTATVSGQGQQGEQLRNDDLNAQAKNGMDRQKRDLQEQKDLPIGLTAKAMDPTTMRLTWTSPGEGVTYELVCRSTSSPELPELTFDFKGRASRPAGQKEWAEFKHLPADGSYTFTLRVAGNGISKTETATKRLAP